ncbi:hypothetical protein [Nocardia nova]|uniref:hypothetical protein n=1 Tax=Nocardia nova TaxID=37330 RepID=UPI0033EAD418
MSEQFPTGDSIDPDQQRQIDEKIAARMGITVEQLHKIDSKVAQDVAARDAVPPEQQIRDDNPKFTKGFGPVTPENEIKPGEISEHYRNTEIPPPADRYHQGE